MLLIVTDDQPAGTTKRMPNLKRAPGFVRFDSYYDNNPLCCPTRATLLTGLYSHHTGVETNLVAKRFDDSSTLATWLDAAGFETGLFGKYMNSYPWDRGRSYVPPGWDRWSAFTPDAAYFDYTLVEDGRPKRYGNAARDYSTDVLARQVDEFIRGSEDPFFAPRWWAKLPRMRTGEQRAAIKGQWRSLLAVDDAVGRFLATLKRQGESEESLVIYVSDNGYSRGSHRWPWKDCAYEECINLPLHVRWPGHTAAGKIDALAGSMDIAPTIAEIAGVEPGLAVDGESLAPLLSGEASSLERPVLLRHVQYPRVSPSFWGVRTERWTYVLHESGERELYDNDRDRHQLRNLAGRPEHTGTEDALEAQIAALR